MSRSIGVPTPKSLSINRRANGRASTPGELTRWSARLDANPNERGVAVDAIIRGDEHRSRAQPIARLYQAYFDRLPDAKGLAYWVEVANDGTGLLEISKYFAPSPPGCVRSSRTRSWAMDFQFDSTTDGKTLKLLNIVDEFARECPAIVVDRSIDADKVVAILDVMRVGLSRVCGLPVQPV